MEKNINDEILRLVFRYLKEDELENVAKVCRSWSTVAKQMENKLRGPVFMKRNRRRTRTRKSWYLVKKLIVKHLNAKPMLQIIFTNDIYVRNYSDECHCNVLPSTCYTLQIESDFSFGKVNRKNFLMSLVFPKLSKLEIETYTFIINNVKNGLFCQEIRFNCGPSIRHVKYFKTKIEPFFKNDSPMQKCIILLCRDFSIYYILDLLQALSDWFPESKIPVWGGLLDILAVCHYCFNKNFCKIKAEIVLMLISSPDMKTWTITLDDTCKNKITIRQKLTTFKEEVELKLHSIAFMHVSSRRIDNLYMFEIYVFKEIFPNIALFPIYGEASFGGKNWIELNETVPKDISIMAGCNTTLMILTYN